MFEARLVYSDNPAFDSAKSLVSLPVKSLADQIEDLLPQTQCTKCGYPACRPYAEAVAEALTNVFGIQPENLAPQGYGEQYLKVNTEAREPQNRRVAIRRITSLVAPVASAN